MRFLNTKRKYILYALLILSIVVVVLSGRPLILTEENDEFSTIVEAWHGGTMAAETLSNILLRKECLSGKITATFPRHLGQIPLYYNHLNTGRPYSNFSATTKYIDCSNEPLFPFGYKLSYNKYVYDKLSINKTKATGDNDSLIVNINVTNEIKTLKFKMTTEKLRFYNQTLKYDWEAGDFNIFVRSNSKDLQKLSS